MVYSQKIAADLKELGVIREKTFVISLTDKIHPKFLSSFCRGIWDGDGTLGRRNDGYPFCQFGTASRKFIVQLSECLRKNGFKNNWKAANRQKYKKGFFNLRILGGRKDMCRFFEWIYKFKGDLYLERKYEKVQS